MRKRLLWLSQSRFGGFQKIGTLSGSPSHMDSSIHGPLFTELHMPEI